MVTTTSPPRERAPSTGQIGTSLSRRRRRRETIAAYLFLAPDALGLLIFVVIPMGLAFAVALYEVDGFGNYTYVGLDNYRTMLSDDQFWQSLKVTGIYVVTFVPLLFAVGLGLALLVRDTFRGVAWVRAALFVPNAISLVVVGLVWQYLLVDKRGAVPRLLDPLGFGDVSFLGEPSLALGTYVVISIWFLMGYLMLLFLAGLKDIPVELEDAARLDGAGPWQRFRHVIFPLLRPTSFFVLVWATISAVTGLQAFDLVYVLTSGGPANSTTTVIFYIYKQAFTLSNIGYASAMTTLVVLLLIIATGTMFALTRGGRFDEE